MPTGLSRLSLRVRSKSVAAVLSLLTAHGVWMEGPRLSSMTRPSGRGR